MSSEILPCDHGYRNVPSDARPSVSWDGTQFVVTWAGGVSVLARRFAADGQPIDPTPIQISSGTWSRDPGAGSRPGETLIAWTQLRENYPSQYQVRAARFTANGDVLDPGGVLLQEGSPAGDFEDNRVESVLWTATSIRSCGSEDTIVWRHHGPHEGCDEDNGHTCGPTGRRPHDPPLGLCQAAKDRDGGLGRTLRATWYGTSRYAFEIVAALDAVRRISDSSTPGIRSGAMRRYPIQNSY
jgi:hypothetical protein